MIVPGQASLIGPSRATFIISFFVLPGTSVKISLAAINAGIVKVMAEFGTSFSELNQPSFTCCILHTASNLGFTLTRSGSLKSANIGIDKRQMTVLANPQKCNINGIILQ